MKIYTLPLVLSMTLLTLTGCGEEKNEEYYKVHPEEAKEKVEACEKAMNDLYMIEDRKEEEKAEKKIKDDKECDFAYKARRNIKKAELQAKKEEADKKNQGLLDEAKKKIIAEHGNLDWKAFMAIYQKGDCSKPFATSSKSTPKGAHCIAMKAHYESLIDNAKNEFAKIPFDELIKEENCKLDKSRHSPCGVWKDSLATAVTKQFTSLSHAELFAKKEKYCNIESEFKSDICKAFNKTVFESSEAELVKYEDDSVFSEAYNQCYEKSKTIKRKNFQTGGQILARTDGKCNAVNQAVLKRKLYDQNNFSKPL